MKRQQITFILLICNLFNFIACKNNRINPLPQEIKEVRVLKGESFLTKSIFYKKQIESFEEIFAKNQNISDKNVRQRKINSEINYGNSFSDSRVCGENIVFAGEFGALTFDKNGNLLKQTSFEYSFLGDGIIITKKNNLGENESYSLTKRNWKIVDLENDGKCEYLAYYYHDGLKVYNEDGDLIWIYGKKDNKGNFDGTVFAANVIDINGDGKNEYVLAKRKEGIFAFDNNQKLLWQTKDFSETVLLDFLSFKLNNQTPFFLVGSEVSRWHLRDSQGEISELFDLPVGSHPIILGDEKSLSDLRFYTIKRNKVKIFDKNGKELLEREAPLEDLRIGENVTAKNENESENEYCVYPKAVWVNWVKGKSKYLAIVTSYLIYDRANFYVYDEKGTLVYHELLPEKTETITVLPNESGADSILIGGKDTIWKFSAN